jgi:hypothetical protein
LAIIDVMPLEQQQKTVEHLRLAARVLEDRGELQAANFCRDVSGEPYPEPKSKPKLRVIE